MILQSAAALLLVLICLVVKAQFRQRKKVLKLSHQFNLTVKELPIQTLITQIQQKVVPKKRKKKRPKKFEMIKQVEVIEQESIENQELQPIIQNNSIYQPILQDNFTFEFILEQLQMIRNYFLRDLIELIPHSQKMMGTYKIQIFDPLQKQKQRKQITLSWRYTFDYPFEVPTINILEITNFSIVYEREIEKKIQNTINKKVDNEQMLIYELLVELFEYTLEINRENELFLEQSRTIIEIKQEQAKNVKINENQNKNLTQQYNQPAKDPKLQEFMNQIFYGHDLVQEPYFHEGEQSFSKTKSLHSTVMKSRYAKEFQETKKIGQGGFGQVYLAKNKLDGNTYAIKKILLNYCDKQSMKTIKQVTLLSQLSHPNIVRYHQSWIQQPHSMQQLFDEFYIQDQEEKAQIQKQYSKWKNQNESDIQFLNLSQQLEQDKFDDEQLSVGSDIFFDRSIDHNQSKLSEIEEPSLDKQVSYHKNLPFKIMYIAMQYCGGLNLKDYINKIKQEKDQKKVQEQRIKITRSILQALVYIHDRKIIHRDLKPANIFLDEKCDKIKLGDFGLATSHQEQRQIKHSQGVGTPFYTAPEQLKSQKYDQKVDIYSLGIILFELYYKFDTGMERNKVLKELTNKKKFPTDFQKFCKTLEQRELIKRLICQDAVSRPTARDLLLTIRNKYFSQIVSAITNPNHFQFKQLLSQIFKIKNSTLKTFIRDPFKNFNYQIIEKVFLAHGASNIHINPIIPVQDFSILNKKKIPIKRDSKFITLSQEGVLLQFANTAYTPWIRCIKQIYSKNLKKKFVCVRRYSFGEILIRQQILNKVIFKQKTVGIFDMVYPLKQETKIIEYQCQMIKMSLEIYESYASLEQNPIAIEISHSMFINIICQQLNLNEDLIYGIMLSDQFKSKEQFEFEVKVESLRKYDLQITLCRRIVNILDVKSQTLEQFVSDLQELIAKNVLIDPIIEHFRQIERILKLMKIQNIIWMVSVPPQNATGPFWRVDQIKGFTSIQEYYKNQQLGNIHVEFEMMNIKKKEIDVYVWSIGQYLEKEIIQIVTDCWNAGINAEWSKQPKGEKVEGIKVGVILKRVKQKISVVVKSFKKNIPGYQCSRQQLSIQTIKTILKAD